MKMLEKVEKAIHDSYLKAGRLDGTWDISAVAKAAIEAMLEPTEELMKFEIDDDVFMWDCNCNYCGGHKFAVQSYLKQALKE